jgi:hypothetical protein
MVQSPYWETKRFSASQEIPCILGHPKVHYHIHKRPPPDPIKSKIHSVLGSPFYYLKIHFTIIIPSTP